MRVMAKPDKQYKDLLKDILKNGTKKGDRTGTGTVSVFGREMRFNMGDGFPLLTTKRVYFKGVVHELLWMLGAMPKEYDEFGNTNIKYLVDHGVNIWVGDAYKSYQKKLDPKKIEIMGYPKTKEEFTERIKTDDYFAKVYGDLGPVYGKQWTAWTSKERVMSEMGGKMEISIPTKEINQIQNAINLLKNDPDNRRNMVNAWNVGEIDEMALPPCHYGFQLYTRVLSNEEREELYRKHCAMNNWAMKINGTHEAHYERANIPTRAVSLKMTQRSCDTFLGVPFNIASYALLLHMIAQCVNMVPEEYIWSGGDVHIYNNHVDQCDIQIGRRARKLPQVILNPEIKNIFDFRYEDIEVKGYKPHPPIKGELSN